MLRICFHHYLLEHRRCLRQPPMAGLRSQRRSVGDGDCDFRFLVVNPRGEILTCFFFLVQSLHPDLFKNRQTNSDKNKALYPHPACTVETRDSGMQLGSTPCVGSVGRCSQLPWVCLCLGGASPGVFWGPAIPPRSRLWEGLSSHSCAVG